MAFEEHSVLGLPSQPVWIPPHKSPYHDIPSEALAVLKPAVTDVSNALEHRFLEFPLDLLPLFVRG